MRNIITAALLSLTAASGTAWAANADIWHDERIAGRDILFYTPKELERSGAGPMVIVFDEDAASGSEIARTFHIWHESKKYGYRAVFAGGIAQSSGAASPPIASLLPMAAQMAIETGSADPANLYILGFGEAAKAALDFACEVPGLLRGVIAIDHPGIDEAPRKAYEGAQGLFVLSVHDGEKSSASASTVNSAAPGRDTSGVDRALTHMAENGAIVQSFAVAGDDKDFLSIGAKFHEQSGASLEELSAAFIGKTISK